MYKAKVTYTGPTKFKVEADNYTVNVEVPKPNESGDGIGPIPMLLGSLGACVAVYLEKYFVGKKMSFNGFTVNVVSELTTKAPLYLEAIDIEIDAPGLNLDAETKESLLRFVRNCPVHNTLHNNPDVSINLA
jgi:uncharacterized OsmC-like protein